MSNKTNFFQTGVFVFIGILLLGSAIYALSSDESVFSGRARVHSYFKDTQGLMFGSIISFSGITIGNVKAIEYVPEKKALRVEYSIKKSFLPIIKTDSKAQLKTQGALGDRFIFISSGSPEAKGIEAGAEIPSKKAGDIFDAVQEKINSLPNFEKIGKGLEELINFLNSEDGLKGSSRELKALLKDINRKAPPAKSIKKLESILTKIDSGQGSLGKLISDPSLYNKVSGFLGGGQSTSDYLKEMARKSIEENEN